ncbi:TIGR03943 family putative permease subunit [Cohnella faecalis]|uniref:TIGR03943 family protein n=1 Tax=Cohnella faecalis TaxID=2315694 RepID=A0A398CX38_9BACL|nr:TIGR03943 family protein [Cohnella faecalis]RIE03564.1 TIGR03943 family protein [Cohnella faecalis]
MKNQSSERALAAHHLIRALILGGIAFYIIHLNNGDRLTLYMAPRMIIYVKIAALALYAVAAVQLYHAVRAFTKQAEPACDCGHDHAASASPLKNTLVYGLFVVPLVVLFATSDTTIGSAMAANKGMNLSTSSAIKKQDTAAHPPEAAPTAANEAQPSPETAAPSSADKASPAANGDQPRFPSDPFTEMYAKFAEKLYDEPVIEVKEKDYIETLTTLDLYLDQFVGKQVSIGGFVYREEGMKASQFILGRFAVQCCTADALPYGVIADYPRASDYGKDEWIKITGVLGKTEYKGVTVMKLEVAKIQKIEAAADPYVYPDMDFGI